MNKNLSGLADNGELCPYGQLVWALNFEHNILECNQVLNIYFILLYKLYIYWAWISVPDNRNCVCLTFFAE